MEAGDGSYQNAPSAYDYNEMLEAEQKLHGKSALLTTRKQSFKNDTEQMDSVEGNRGDYLVNLVCTKVSHDLLISRLFYFFFYAAFGSLFPLIAVYFKQLGMNPAQAGFLVGVRPIVDWASAPFWGGFAIKYKKGRYLLLFSLICWILFTVVLAFIAPAVQYCLYRLNTTEYYLGGEEPKMKLLVKNWPDREDAGLQLGMSPAQIGPDSHVANFNPQESALVRPPASTQVYQKTSVEEVFLLLLLLIIIGEFLSAPAINLADACTLSYIEDSPATFGRQRMFGSIGWGIAMFFVGIALQYSDMGPTKTCPTDRTKNYTTCFSIFSVLMACALIDATQFRFNVESSAERPDCVPQRVMDAEVQNIAPAVAEKARAGAPEPLEASRGPAWLSTLKTFRSPHYACFLFVAWWFGVGIGLVFTFLFWHLQDIGGTPFLFGVASVLNHVSEVIVHFFSIKAINKLGHMYVLYIGLLINVLRFLYISIIDNPWWVLPFEFVQGITHAAVWVAASSYMSLTAPVAQKESAQHLLETLHHGLGRACGAIFGGVIVTYTGTRVVYRAYGTASLLIVAIFFGINRFFKIHAIKYQAADFDEGALAPHGIPMNVPYSPMQDDHSGGYQQQELRADPTQDAYDKYIHEPYDSNPVKIEALPSLR